MEQAKSIEVYTPSGILLCKAILTDLTIPTQSRSESLSGHVATPTKGNGKANGEPITDPQRRLLFRLIATIYKLEKEQVFEKLKELFGVKTLNEVSKSEASKMIERLLDEERGGGQ